MPEAGAQNHEGGFLEAEVCSQRVRSEGMAGATGCKHLQNIPAHWEVWPREHTLWRATDASGRDWHLGSGPFQLGDGAVQQAALCPVYNLKKDWGKVATGGAGGRMGVRWVSSAEKQAEARCGRAKMRYGVIPSAKGK